MIVSTLNTLVFYVDAKIYHYYEYHMIFGVFWIRIASGIVNDTVVRAASREECVRRYERVKTDFDNGKVGMDMLARALSVMAKAD